MPTRTPKYFKAWIFFFLIATIGGMVLGGTVGFIIGVAMGIAHMELGLIKVVCGVVGFLLGVPLSYFTFRWVVAEFIVKELTPTPPSDPSAEPPPL